MFPALCFAAVPQGDPSRRAAGTSDTAPATPSGLPLPVCHTLGPGVQGSKPLNQGTGLEKVRNARNARRKSKNQIGEVDCESDLNPIMPLPPVLRLGHEFFCLEKIHSKHAAVDLTVLFGLFLASFWSPLCAVT